MLDVKRNRLNYGELISPPEGFELTKAIGTTYTLDLYALLAIPVALFYAKSMEGDFQLNRYDVLDAIRQSTEKVDIFCQRGKIKVPTNYNNLLAFMEGCIEEVHPPIVDSTFHPKLWVLRFESDDETIYRLVVLSRNLTFDRSWDISYFCDGKPTAHVQTESKKISTYLKSFYKTSGRKIDPNFFAELEKVVFDIPNGFSDFEIFPIDKFSSKTNGFDNPLENAKYKKMIVISPFLDITTLRKLKKSSRGLTVISRKEELDKLDHNQLRGMELYHLNPLIADGEDILDTEGIESMSQNLHAKIFIGDTGEASDWYMGSANATSPAFDRNVELLVKVRTVEKYKRLKRIKWELLYQQETLFQPYTPAEEVIKSEEESVERKVRELSYYLTKQSFIGEVKKNANNENYSLKLKVDLTNIENDDFTIETRLIHRKDDFKNLKTDTVNELEFNNISIVNLSSYLIVNIRSKSEFKGSVTIKMKVDIPNEREDVIFNNLINSKVKFFEYLQFLLSPDQLNGSLLIKDSAHQNTDDAGILQDILGMNNSIYESLMFAASRSPKKLIEIDRIIQKLEQADSSVLEDFMPIWTVFKEFAHA